MIAALFLSLQVTAVVVVLLLVIGLPVGYFLARKKFAGKFLVETLINLPLVLPPTVVGFYLLLVLGQDGPLVRWFGVEIVFTWYAVVLAAAVMGMPLMVNAARVGLAGVEPQLENAARTLGAGEWEVFWRVTLPLARRGIAAGLLLGTIRALGEFGASMMVAGNIPGKTQTMPIAVYDAVSQGHYVEANLLVLVMSALAIAGLFTVRQLEQRASVT